MTVKASMTELDKIARRIAGRESACAGINLAKDGNTNDMQFMVGVARYCREFADTILGPMETQVVVMSKDEAEVYERLPITFGRYQGQEIRNVPIDYLCWLADSSIKLQSYLRSSVGEKRKEAEA